MACWRLYRDREAGEDAEEQIEVTRLKVPGAPVFSLAKIPDVLPDGTVARRKPTAKPPGIYLGTAAKEVLTWMLGSKDVNDKVVLDGHTGWVRSLAVADKWLFSCGCNWLRVWDTTYRTPKEVSKTRLFTGDILAIATAKGRVYTAGADGSLRSWVIPRSGSGALEEGPAVERAHEGRVSACLVHGGVVYTTSYDGSIKAWCATTLTLLAEARRAHGGDKVFCAAVGANGVLFTGGDDKLIRAWDPLLSPIGQPLDSHTSSVRVLAAGRTGLLVSGDAEGDVCIWEVCQVQLPGLNGRNGPTGFSAGGPNGSGSPGGSMASLSSVEVSMSDAVMMQLEEYFSPSKPAVQQQQQQEGVAIAVEQAAAMASAMAMGVAAGALAREQVQVQVAEECLDAGADVGYLAVQQEEVEDGHEQVLADADASEVQVCCGEADVGSDSETAVGEVMMQHHHRWHGVQPEGEDPEPWVSSHPVDVQQEEEEEGLELEESLSQTVWNNLPSEGLGLEVPVSRNGVAFSQLQQQRQQQQVISAAAAVAGWAEVVDPGQGVFDEEPVAAALSELTSAAYNGAGNGATLDVEGAEFAAADSGQGFAVEWGAAEGQQRLQQLYASDFAASA